MSGVSQSEACPSCHGSGKIGYRMPAGESVTMLDGTVIQDMGGHGTRACECVRDVPAQAGKATWWESETIHREVIDVPIFEESVDVTATCEVPRNEWGLRMLRTAENAYYPPLVEFEASSTKLTLHSDTARELAAALIAAADACDEADELCVATMPNDEPMEVDF